MLWSQQRHQRNAEVWLPTFCGCVCTCNQLPVTLQIQQPRCYWPWADEEVRRSFGEERAPGEPARHVTTAFMETIVCYAVYYGSTLLLRRN